MAKRCQDETADDDFRLNLLATLMGPHGSKRFDHITKCPCVKVRLVVHSQGLKIEVLCALSLC